MDGLGIFYDLDRGRSCILLHFFCGCVGYQNVAVRIIGLLSMLIGHGEVLFGNHVIGLAGHIADILLICRNGRGLDLDFLGLREVITHTGLERLILIAQPLQVAVLAFLHGNRLACLILCRDRDLGIGCRHTVVNGGRHITLLRVSDTRTQEYDLIVHQEPGLIAGCILISDKVVGQQALLLCNIAVVIAQLHASHADTVFLERYAAREGVGANREVYVIILLGAACRVLGIELAAVIQLHNGLACLVGNGCTRQTIGIHSRHIVNAVLLGLVHTGQVQIECTVTLEPGLEILTAHVLVLGDTIGAARQCKGEVLAEL